MTKKLLIMIALAIVQIAWGMEEEKQDTEELITIITKDCSDGIKVSKLVAKRIPLFAQLLIDNANNSIDLSIWDCATKDTLHDVRLRRLLSWLKADVKIALSVI